jgi:hypothetical protein
MKQILLIIMSLVFLKANAQDPAYPPVTAPPLNVVKAEYFIDVDPGFGLGINIPVTAAVNIAGLVQTINISALSPGLHKLSVRTLNAEGNWSITSTILFAIDPNYPSAPAAPLNIVKAEYFIDADPGFGLGTNVPLTAAVDITGLAASINTAALTIGTHFLYLRTLNVEGSWSVTSVKQFVVDSDPAYPTAPAAPGNITFAEYFFDTDPGFGNGISISLTPGVDVSNVTFAAATGTLTTGTHKLYVRSLDDWSITSVRDLEVTGVLPVTFVSFTGKHLDNKILLQWITASESNSSHFEIERSMDGVNFSTIGTVRAAGNSRQHITYNFATLAVQGNVHWYRLKQVDKDGKFIYSAIIVIRMNNDQSVLLLPNPVANSLQLRGVAINAPLRIYNAWGSLVLAAKWNGLSVNVSSLPAGNYSLQIQQGDVTVVKRFMK